MDRSVFLKCRFSLDSLFLSLFRALFFVFLITIGLCFFFLRAPRTLIFFLCLAMYAFVSPFNSFVILCSLNRSLRHCITFAFAFLFLSFFLTIYITDSLPAPSRLFTRSRLPFCPSYSLPFYRLFVYLSFVLSRASLYLSLFFFFLFNEAEACIPHFTTSAVLYIPVPRP